MENIDRESLQKKIESGADFVLVDALSPMSFAAAHLPGAINLTPGWVDERARRRIPDLDTEVVVYCQGLGLRQLGRRSRTAWCELGYRNIRHYAGGVDDWRDAGLPLEGGRV